MLIKSILGLAKRLAFWGILLVALLFIVLMPMLFPKCGRVGLYLQAIGVGISTLIVISAIWGEQIRARFFGPKLFLSLLKPEGEETFISNAENTPVRYYHLKVENKRKGLIAKNVQVVLLSINSPYKGGENKTTTIGGRLPFPWSFREKIKGLEDRIYYSNIGPDDICDLACLIKGGVLTILAAEWNLIKDQVRLAANQKASVEAVAIADNAQSNRLALEISWDGRWPENDPDALNHIVIQKPKRVKGRRGRD